MFTKNTLFLAFFIFLPAGVLFTQNPTAPVRQRQRPPAQAQRSPAQTQQVPARVQRPPAQVQRSPAQTQRTPSQVQRSPAQIQRTSAQANRPKKRSKIEHRWGINTAFLVQNAPFREFSIFTNGSWYVQGYRAWMAANAGLGLSFGFSYDVTFLGGGLFRTQLQLETTGWILGVLDIGGGVRVPIKNGISASIEGYFSTGLSGGSLARLADHQDRQSFSVVFFGFKARGSVEFPIKKNWYSSIYVSYAAYPWHAANKKSLYINGIRVGAIIDSLQIGVEFGQRF